MQEIWERSGVALGGIITSALTVLAVTLINNAIGFNIFTFNAWLILPAGAGICGFCAASGYFLAAKFLHKRPTKATLAQMILVAAITQFAIYWFEYSTLNIDGIHVADRVSFSDYLRITLTSAHLRIGRALQNDTGEVGDFGYWLAGIDFIGFLLGGFCVYIYLQIQPICSKCSKYLRQCVKKADSFQDAESFASYFDNVYTNPVNTKEFNDHVSQEHSAGKVEKGFINLTTVVFECPFCFSQSVRETVQVYNGRDWKDVDQFKRFVAMPENTDVRSAFTPST